MAFAGATSAATIDFDNGVDGGTVYTQDLLQIVEIGGGNISTPNDCGSKCLNLQNDNSVKVYKLTHTDPSVAFSLTSFSYNGRDNKTDDALYVSSVLPVDLAMPGLPAVLFQEDNNGNTMTATGPLTMFNDVFALYFWSASEGSARLDNLAISVSSVPLPAGGLLLLAGLGALGLAQRRKV